MAAQDVPEHKLKLAEVLEMMIADGLASNAGVLTLAPSMTSSAATWTRSSDRNEPMKEILQYLKKHGERLDAEIAEATCIPLTKVRVHLSELAAQNMNS